MEAKDSKKKTTTSKKKKVVKQENKVSTKETKTIRGRKKEKFSFQEFCTSYATLWTIFVLLILLIIVLGVMIYQKNEKEKHSAFANMKVSVVKKDDEFSFGISALTLAQTDQYIFKIMNYKKNSINQEEIPYKVIVDNATDSVIKVTKNDSDEDLMKEQSYTVIEEGVLSKDEQEDIYYHVTITSSGKLSSKDVIYVKIIS